MDSLFKLAGFPVDEITTKVIVAIIVFVVVVAILADILDW